MSPTQKSPKTQSPVCENATGRTSSSWTDAFPEPQGLYHPSFEKDACGVGFIANLNGLASRELVSDARILLCNMSHRGAEGANVLDSDGAGIMTSLPHDFFRAKVPCKVSKDLPLQGEYAAGNVFLPTDDGKQQRVIAQMKEVADELGLSILHLRDVPTNDRFLGPASLSKKPAIKQIFIAKKRDPETGESIMPEESLLIQCHLFEKLSIRRLDDPSSLYFCSLSTNRIVYKALSSPTHLFAFYPDLEDSRYTGTYAMVHSRFSTNTFPSWDRAQPLRHIAHNGEINTLRGNKTWMASRTPLLRHPRSRIFNRYIKQLHPVCDPTTSDSGAMDNVLQLLCLGAVGNVRDGKCESQGIGKFPEIGDDAGLSVVELVMMLVPIALGGHLSSEVRGLHEEVLRWYQWAAGVMEAWDGPACVNFADGRYIGAALDRNGLRPCRWYRTPERLICGSEVGAVPARGPILQKGRVQPGRLICVDLAQGKVLQSDQVWQIVGRRWKYFERSVSPARGEPFHVGVELTHLIEDLGKAKSTDFMKEPVRAETMMDGVASESPVYQEKTLEESEEDGSGVIGVIDGEVTRVFKGLMSGSDVTLTNGTSPSAGAHRPGTVLNHPKLKLFGWSLDMVNTHLVSMASKGTEPLGSMGTDTPLAFMSSQPVTLADYFHQLFAQVTNPPIDPIRESVVMTLRCPMGGGCNALEFNPQRQGGFVWVDSPLITGYTLDAIKEGKLALAFNKLSQRFSGVKGEEWNAVILDTTYPVSQGLTGYRTRLEEVCKEAVKHVERLRRRCLVLSDRSAGVERIPLSSIAITGAVHQSLLEAGVRGYCSIIVETGEVREVHQLAVLMGCGGDVVYPYIAMELIASLQPALGQPLSLLIKNFMKAMNTGLLKIMSKMGISLLQSYKAAMIFEGVGIGKEIWERCFASGGGIGGRIGGITFEALAADALHLHSIAYPRRLLKNPAPLPPHLAESGSFHYRTGGEDHVNIPESIANLQEAVRRENNAKYQKYEEETNSASQKCTIRGLFEFAVNELRDPIPVENVEPWTNIVKRFVTGAMSYGSISWEAHTSLARAMNKIGGKSNTGEGGEDPERSATILGDGTSLRSRIKQVASGRFGVTSFYLSDSDEIQIKMAQGAKPGEGGELPGHKVSASIAKTRKSTPGVGLISPPPHHDIYSIEDLKQLIFDLKSGNPDGRVSVKLVSIAGVGVVAAGVAKAKADHILIAGWDGGTGASRWTSIKHAGIPWELGLAESHQTLVLNDLRGRVVVQCDGGLKTARDVAIACLLGAEEFGFATAPLIAMGCIMMRKCHLNTCPVGIATQDPELRKKFDGQPEHVINYFHYLAEELRKIMASLGFRSIREMVGRSECLRVRKDVVKANPKMRYINLESVLVPAHTMRPGVDLTHTQKQDHGICERLDYRVFVPQAKQVIETGGVVEIESDIANTDRAVGAILSFHISKKHGEKGLPNDSIAIRLRGSAGQSLGAFLSPGITMNLIGDANDYVGKSLSGGIIIVRPPEGSAFPSHENTIVGNACLYGATSGKVFLRGMASERFAVRNSGATAVVEGVGDHGCEYMTGGIVVILGGHGRNFAAGMSGGYAYVFHLNPRMVNQALVDLDPLVPGSTDEQLVHDLVYEHAQRTDSLRAKALLGMWEQIRENFSKVFPRDLKRIIQAGVRSESDAEGVSGMKELPPGLTPVVDGATENAESSDATIESGSDGTESLSTRGATDIEDSIAADEQPVDRLKGFVKYRRQGDRYRKPSKRAKDFEELASRLKPKGLKIQAARCMDCGVPFCQSSYGCPIANVIPKWNELVFHGQWREAYHRLALTNNFPEFTGRVCPAPCEGACVLGINEDPVSIKSIECAIIDKAFAEGWVIPQPPETRTGRTIAVVGSGPSGLAAADQLNKAGHSVKVYERNDRIGGLLVYGIPNMKLDKAYVDRRVRLMKDEGVYFYPNTSIGHGDGPEGMAPATITMKQLKDENDIILLATGATWPRDLPIEGRNLNGIHYAMEFLEPSGRSWIDSKLKDGRYISAKGKKVIVIGGGDTGNDCIGTSVRHGADSVTNFELLPRPPNSRAPENPWPLFPRVFKLDYGHEEVKSIYGYDPREYSILSKRFVDDGKGNVSGVDTVQVEWTQVSGKWIMKEVPGTERLFKADLVLLAMGFLGPEQKLPKGSGLSFDARGNIKAVQGRYRSVDDAQVYLAGDCRRGQSLVVWAINEGRMAAREIDERLQGVTHLAVTGGTVKRRWDETKTLMYNRTVEPANA